MTMKSMGQAWANSAKAHRKCLKARRKKEAYHSIRGQQCQLKSLGLSLSYSKVELEDLIIPGLLILRIG